MPGPKPGSVGSSRKGLEGPTCSIRQRADAKVQAPVHMSVSKHTVQHWWAQTHMHTHTETQKHTRREAAATQKVVPQWDVRWDEESSGLGQGLGQLDLHHWAAGVETILL